MARYEKYEALLIDVEDRIATITMNSPGNLNAIAGGMHTEFAHIFRDLNDDSEVNVIVLTGAGRVFSAGGDIKWMQELIDDPSKLEQPSNEGKRIVYSMLECEKPIIAKVNGHATGLGATLALFCDVIFASEAAKIGDPHVRVGFVAGDGGAVIWPQLIGFARAKEYLMTGDLLPAAEAARIGLINHAVPLAELDQRTYEFARKLADGPLNAIKWTKIAINIPLKLLAHSMMDASISFEAQSNRTADHAEAVAAFREGRLPRFTGR